MSIRRVLPVLFCSLIALPTGRAQNEPQKTDTGRFGNPTSTAGVFQGYIYGVIKKIDTKSNELILDKTKFGIDQAFKLEARTKYIHDGKPSSLDHLKVGDPVYVDAKKDKRTGDLVVKKVVTGVAPAQLP